MNYKEQRNFRNTDRAPTLTTPHDETQDIDYETKPGLIATNGTLGARRKRVFHIYEILVQMWEF